MALADVSADVSAAKSCSPEVMLPAEQKAADGIIPQRGGEIVRHGRDGAAVRKHLWVHDEQLADLLARGHAVEQRLRRVASGRRRTCGRRGLGCAAVCRGGRTRPQAAPPAPRARADRRLRASFALKFSKMYSNSWLQFTAAAAKTQTTSHRRGGLVSFTISCYNNGQNFGSACSQTGGAFFYDKIDIFSGFSRCRQDHADQKADCRRRTRAKRSC